MVLITNIHIYLKEENVISVIRKDPVKLVVYEWHHKECMHSLPERSERHFNNKYKKQRVT